MKIAATGKNTYKKRESLKAIGLNWDSQNKVWFAETNEESELNRISAAIEKTGCEIIITGEFEAVEPVKYDKKWIMTRAWQIRKSAAGHAGCKVSEISMSECMILAWQEEKSGIIKWQPTVELNNCLKYEKSTSYRRREVDETEGGYQEYRY